MSVRHVRSDFFVAPTGHKKPACECAQTHTSGDDGLTKVSRSSSLLKKTVGYISIRAAIKKAAEVDSES